MAGNDVFLFSGNLGQDYRFMLDGVASGALTAERLDDAVRTTLCLKASLGLHRRQADAGTSAGPGAAEPSSSASGQS